MFTMKFENYKDEFEKIINQVIDKHLTDQKYNYEKAQEWVNIIVKEAVTEIHESKKFEGYKVMCSAIILQKNGSYMHFSSKCIINPMCDGYTMVKWEAETFCVFFVLYAVIN